MGIQWLLMSQAAVWVVCVAAVHLCNGVVY